MQASVLIKMDSGLGTTANGGPSVTQTRTFRYEAPNRFRIDSTGQAGERIIAVSDGNREADYDNRRTVGSSINVAAPASLAAARTSDMSDPNLCGSLIYPFFGGSANFGKLVSGPVKLVGETKTPDGDPVRVIEFNTPDLIGNVTAAISIRSGWVYVVKYDFSGARHKLLSKLPALRAEAKKENPHLGEAEIEAQLNQLLQTRYTEDYENIRVGQPLSSGSFDLTIPGPDAIAQLPMVPPSGSASPIPLGTPAPDATVTTLDGKSVRLSSLRGHPVMIDFWATWCGPCREGLPETAKLTIQGSKAGLKVLAVTDENTDTVKAFLGKQNYRLEAYRDEGDRAQKAFLVGGLPSQVFIDPKGKIVSYLVGAHSPAEVLAALGKTGIHLTD